MSDMGIDRLMDTLGLGTVTGQPVSVSGGLLHKMYHVTTSAGEYAVKALNPEIMKRPEALRNMINSEKIATAFAETVPLVHAIEIGEKQVQYFDGRYYLVFPWAEGASVFGQDITLEHCREIGNILGKLHGRRLRLEGVVPEDGTFEMFAWDYYTRCIADLNDKDREWIAAYKNAGDDIKAWNEKACASSSYLSRLQVISHRDLDTKNVMWSGERAYVIDWEAAGYVNPHQEFLEVVNYWADDGSGKLDKRKFDMLITEYRKYMDTAEVDWDAVFSGSYIGILGWLEYNVKRALGLEVSDESEITLGEEQITGTIQELYSYQEKLRQIKEWIG